LHLALDVRDFISKLHWRYQAVWIGMNLIDDIPVCIDILKETTFGNVATRAAGKQQEGQKKGKHTVSFRCTHSHFSGK